MLKTKCMYLLVLLLTIGTFSMKASEEDAKILVVSLTNGNSYRYVTLDDPRLTYGQDSLIITSNASQAVYLIPQVEKMYFENEVTSVITPKANQVSFNFTQKNVILVQGDIQGCTANLYNLNGGLLKSIPSKGSNLTIDVSDLDNGVYIINIKGQSIKFKKS